MRRIIALLLGVLVLLSLTACGQDETVSTPEPLMGMMQENLTVTPNGNGTTTVTANPVTTGIPTRADPNTTRQMINTTTKPQRNTTTTVAAPKVTVSPSTATKPAPVPTAPVTTTTAVGTKAFAYQYTTGQRHTWLPMEMRYMYSQLDDAWKTCYRKIDEAVRHLDTAVLVDVDLSSSMGHNIYFMYMMDHPELFYLGSSCGITFDGKQYGFQFSYAVGNKAGEYCGTQDNGQPTQPMTDALRNKIRQKKIRFDAMVDAIISTIPSNVPDAVKERMLYDYIITHSNYNVNAQGGGMADDDWTAYGVVVNGTGVCESYAEAFQTLCNAVGINCIGIDGIAKAGEVNGQDVFGNHKWNAVKLNGEWYQCDITFDDPVGAPTGYVGHEFFNLTGAQMSVKDRHVMTGHDEPWPVPKCNGTKYSWPNFVKLYGA